MKRGKSPNGLQDELRSLLLFAKKSNAAFARGAAAAGSLLPNISSLPDTEGAACNKELITLSRSADVPEDGGVPHNTIIVLGDNRENAQDSRYFGYLPVKNVVGLV